MKLNSLSLVITILAVSGCAWLSSSSNNKSYSGRSKLPKVQIQKPGGSGNNWRYLGTTDDGVVVDEIDINSINGVGGNANTQVFNYQDRKTVVIPNQFSYPSNQPRFKYLLSTWQINCTSKEYILSTTTLYNESGVKLIHYNYANNSDVKWLQLGNGSFAQMQYNFICLNINRNLGY